MFHCNDVYGSFTGLTCNSNWDTQTSQYPQHTVSFSNNLLGEAEDTTFIARWGEYSPIGNLNFLPHKFLFLRGATPVSGIVDPQQPLVLVLYNYLRPNQIERIYLLPSGEKTYYIYNDTPYYTAQNFPAPVVFTYKD